MSRLRARLRSRPPHTFMLPLLGMIAGLAITVAPPLRAQTIRIRMGTVAPKGSVWTEELERISQQWRDLSGGRVDLKIYPGGVLGDDPEMLRKVRSGTLQAVALSQIGLARVDEGVACLSIPLLFRSDAELDAVLERLAPELERRIEAQGYVVLNWGEAGWVRFFTKSPMRTPDDLRRMKLFTSAGDPEGERLWKEFGFNVVPMSLTDLHTALQTGMIDAFDVPPLFALLNRTYTLANYMLDLPLAPIVGGTIVERATWERIPEDLRPELLEVSRAAGDRLREKVRTLGADSIVEMRNRGLVIIEADAAIERAWQQEAQAAYPRLRGRYAPRDLFERAESIVEELRRSTGEAGNRPPPATRP